MKKKGTEKETENNKENRKRKEKKKKKHIQHNQTKCNEKTFYAQKLMSKKELEIMR